MKIVLLTAIVCSVVGQAPLVQLSNPEWKTGEAVDHYILFARSSVSTLTLSPFSTSPSPAVTVTILPLQYTLTHRQSCSWPTISSFHFTSVCQGQQLSTPPCNKPDDSSTTFGPISEPIQIECPMGIQWSVKTCFQPTTPILQLYTVNPTPVTQQVTIDGVQDYEWTPLTTSPVLAQLVDPDTLLAMYYSDWYVCPSSLFNPVGYNNPLLLCPSSSPFPITFTLIQDKRHSPVQLEYSYSVFDPSRCTMVDTNLVHISIQNGSSTISIEPARVEGVLTLPLAYQSTQAHPHCELTCLDGTQCRVQIQGPSGCRVECAYPSSCIVEVEKGVQWSTMGSVWQVSGGEMKKGQHQCVFKASVTGSEDWTWVSCTASGEETGSVGSMIWDRVYGKVAISESNTTMSCSFEWSSVYVSCVWSVHGLVIGLGVLATVMGITVIGVGCHKGARSVVMGLVCCRGHDLDGIREQEQVMVTVEMSQRDETGWLRHGRRW